MQKFVNDAVEAHLVHINEDCDAAPWMTVFAGLKRDGEFHKEMKRIAADIEAEFEKLDAVD